MTTHGRTTVDVRLWGALSAGGLSPDVHAFSRHARNQMRRLRLSANDVIGICVEPDLVDRDPDGRVRYVGRVRQKRFRVVMAVDKPDLVVTVHERRS